MDGFEPIGYHVKSPPVGGLFTWLGFGYGNITFEDSLDFDASEIESVYEVPKDGKRCDALKCL